MEAMSRLVPAVLQLYMRVCVTRLLKQSTLIVRRDRRGLACRLCRVDQSAKISLGFLFAASDSARGAGCSPIFAGCGSNR